MRWYWGGMVRRQSCRTMACLRSNCTRCGRALPLRAMDSTGRNESWNATFRFRMRMGMPDDDVGLVM
jgi:hypothetical protein